ncbi:sensor histidine kinase [Alkalimonas amylolytica]|uniref:histidine kinase n=1 Tax=Alkalimonas amylolytica TaxID=152573 RepID=A0A1H3ZIA0_ALKAM|nr:ATP-binding protein [Alkalimonas amylolytica]SEA23151.1 PAS fold-containing protein [Alkalimonas amylolytica]
MTLDELFPYVIRQLPIGVCVVNPEYNVVTWNNFFAERLNITEQEVHGRTLADLFPQQFAFLKRKIDSAFLLNHSSFSYWEQRPHVFQFQSSRPITGEETAMYQNIELFPLSAPEAAPEFVCIIVHDVTVQASYYQELRRMAGQLEQERDAQKELLRKLKETQSQLLQSEKMASIGQLAAGVAHEINNPIGYINSNIQSLKDYMQTYTQYNQSLMQLIDSTGLDKLIAQKDLLAEEKQINYLNEDIWDLINESLEGAERVIAIVRSLKDFSHVDSSEWCYADITQGIENTLKILQHEIKYKAIVHRDYQPELPLLYCQPMQLNQVFMNLLVNAAQAIEDKGDIYISVQTPESGVLEIKVRDTGCGISNEIQQKIFEPFFTTKPVGSGTGLGLSLSYGIIKQHKGDIQVSSQPEQGTEFCIRLPIVDEPTDKGM